MGKIIGELWNGNIQPCVNLGKENNEIGCIISLLTKNGEKLQSMLDKEQEKVFIKYCEKTEDYLSLLTEQAFCDGFRLGCKIMVEALTEEE